MSEVDEEYERYYRVEMPDKAASERDTASNLAVKRHRAKTEYSSTQMGRALSLPLSFERQIAPLISAIERLEGTETTRNTPVERIHLAFTTSADHTEIKYEVSYLSEAQSTEEQAVERLMKNKDFMSRVSELVAEAIISGNTDKEIPKSLVSGLVGDEDAK